MKKAETYKSQLLDSLFDDISPRELKRTEKQMQIAIKISDALEAKNWGRGAKKRLAQELGYKSPSIVTKWLSGTHNFTMDTLSDLEEILGINLLCLEEYERQLEQVDVFMASFSTTFQPNSSLIREGCFSGQGLGNSIDNTERFMVDSTGLLINMRTY